jgi:hypothetical protein
MIGAVKPDFEIASKSPFTAAVARVISSAPARLATGRVIPSYLSTMDGGRWLGSLGEA